MTDEEFAIGIDAILMVPITGHAQHRALDLWWTRYAIEKGGVMEAATRKWMAAIEGDHAVGNPYPLGKRTWRTRLFGEKPKHKLLPTEDWGCP